MTKATINLQVLLVKLSSQRPIHAEKRANSIILRGRMFSSREPSMSRKVEQAAFYVRVRDAQTVERRQPNPRHFQVPKSAGTPAHGLQATVKRTRDTLMAGQDPVMLSGHAPR